MKKLLFILGALVFAGCAKESASTGQENQAGESVKVGVIQFAEHVALDRARDGFIDELEAKGFEVEADVVNVQSDLSLIPTTASNFEAQGVDLIYAIATPAAQGAKNVVKDTPTIFNAVTDPVSAELVASNEEPGGMVTGVSDYFPIEKQLDLFLEIFPESKDMGLIYSTGEVNSENQIKELEPILEARGIKLHKVGVSTTNDVPAALASLTGKIDSYVQIQDNLAASAAAIIAKELAANKIPSFAGEVGPVEGGLLLTDGIDYSELGRLAAGQAEEILKGKSAGEIPVIFSDNVGRVVNKKTFEALGLTDESILEGAEIIE